MPAAIEEAGDDGCTPVATDKAEQIDGFEEVPVQEDVDSSAGSSSKFSTAPSDSETGDTPLNPEKAERGKDLQDPEVAGDTGFADDVGVEAGDGVIRLADGRALWAHATYGTLHVAKWCDSADAEPRLSCGLAKEKAEPLEVWPGVWRGAVCARCFVNGLT